MTPRTILVLGGGIGGIAAATRLRALLPKPHRVVLIERALSFVFAPSLIWLMTGDRTARQITRPLDGLARRGIDVVQGEIERIDPALREVVVSGRRLAGDYLVIALGAELAPETIPGLAGAGHNFYTLKGAEGFRDAFIEFSGGTLAIVTATPAYKCPAAPYETAMLLEAACRKRRIRDRTEIVLYAAEPGPMGVAGPAVSAAVRQMVEAKGISYRPEHQIQQVDPTERRLHFAEGMVADFDLMAYVPPHRAPAVVRESGLTGANGWVGVDRNTLATDHAGIFALGDVVAIPLTLGRPLPKAGVFAGAQAEVVAGNIAHRITGKGKPQFFTGDGGCFIEVGDGKAGFGQGDFYAEPVPRITLREPRRFWHGAKVMLEKDWIWRRL